MAQRVQIQCINKSDRQNPHERITHVGGIRDGVRWRLLEDEAIYAIKSEQVQFFVSQAGFTANVIVATHLGRDYLKTEADGVTPDNLLSLPECPSLLRSVYPLAGLTFPNSPVVPQKPAGFA